MVFDPGVLVSARISFGGKGAPAGLLRAWFEGRFDLVVSEKLLGELGRVLSRPKLVRYTSAEEVSEYVLFLRRAALTEPDPEPLTEPLTPDPKDDYLVALARAADAGFLVSGDPHLTGLEDPRPPVLTPRAFLRRLHSSAP